MDVGDFRNIKQFYKRGKRLSKHFPLPRQKMFIRSASIHWVRWFLNKRRNGPWLRSFMRRRINGHCIVRLPREQRGSFCVLHATVAALYSRYAMYEARHGRELKYTPSVQHLIDAIAGNLNSSDPELNAKLPLFVFNWLKENYITNEFFYPFDGGKPFEGKMYKDASARLAEFAQYEKQANVIVDFPRYSIADYKVFNMAIPEDRRLAIEDLHANGALVAGFVTTRDYDDPNNWASSGGIFLGAEGKMFHLDGTICKHMCAVIGDGVEGGIHFLHFFNSYGQNWGINGAGKIALSAVETLTAFQIPLV